MLYIEDCQPVRESERERERDRRDIVPIISCLSAVSSASTLLAKLTTENFQSQRMMAGSIQNDKILPCVLTSSPSFGTFSPSGAAVCFREKRQKSTANIQTVHVFLRNRKTPDRISIGLPNQQPAARHCSLYISYTCFDGYQIEKLPPILSRKRRKRQCLITGVSRPLPSSHRRRKKRWGVLGIRSTSLFCCDHVSGSPFPSSSSS